MAGLLGVAGTSKNGFGGSWPTLPFARSALQLRKNLQGPRSGDRELVDVIFHENSQSCVAAALGARHVLRLCDFAARLPHKSRRAVFCHLLLRRRALAGRRAQGEEGRAGARGRRPRGVAIRQIPRAARRHGAGHPRPRLGQDSQECACSSGSHAKWTLYVLFSVLTHMASGFFARVCFRSLSRSSLAIT